MSVEILDLAALALTAVFFALLYYLHKKKHVDFGVRTILAVGLGLIVGLAFKGHHVYVAAVGTVYAHVVSAPCWKTGPRATSSASFPASPIWATPFV